MPKNIYTFHYTYLITNTNNQMKYIGVRSCSCLPENDDEYMGSSKILVEAMQETPEVFTKTIIDTFSTREIANTNEQWLHETYDVARNSEFYNQMIAPSEFCMFGKTGKNSHWYGKHHSLETKKKMSIAQGGEKHPMYGKAPWNKGKTGCFSSETRKKMSEIRMDKPLSEETRKRMSESHKGKKHPMYGKKHSDETKKKISAAQKGKKKPPFTEEHRRNLSLAWKKRKLLILKES